MNRSRNNPQFRKTQTREEIAESGINAKSKITNNLRNRKKWQNQENQLNPEW